MTELEKATWEFLFDTPSISLLKHGSPYSDFVEAVTSDREKAFKAGVNWQKQQLIDKACEWLNDCAYFYVNDYTGSLNEEALVEDFRKAMEE